MKLKSLFKFLTVATLSLGSISVASADSDAEALRKVYNEKKASVYGVKGILKLNITFNGQAQNQEAPLWSNATCIGDGILVASYASLSPQLGAGRPGLEVTKELEGLKLINAAGEEFDAKLILHDEDLGLAFLALDPKGENAAGWKATAIDISKDVELKHLDTTVNISRHNTNFRYQTGVTKGSVATILEKPRKSYQIIGASMSAPCFTTTGDFIGITVASSSPVAKGQQPQAVTIPAKYIRNLVEQAKAKQAELAK